MKAIKAGVLEIAYIETGPMDGDPVVLLHGLRTTTLLALLPTPTVLVPGWLIADPAHQRIESWLATQPKMKLRSHG